MARIQRSFALLSLLPALACAMAPQSALAQATTPSAEQMIEQLKGPPRTRGLSRNLTVERAPAQSPPPAAAAALSAPAESAPPVATAEPAGATQPQRASLSLLIQFDFDSVQVRPESRQALVNLAQALQSTALASSRFAVQGHTDAKGNAEYNRKLSQRRAEAVRDFLGSQGVAAMRLQAHGLGASELANPGEPFAAENRRVRIVNLE